jgi:hypothetical protein
MPRGEIQINLYWYRNTRSLRGLHGLHFFAIPNHRMYVQYEQSMPNLYVLHSWGDLLE